MLEPGAPRVEAPCIHFPACGGCRYQDLAYETQLEAKASQVSDALARIGGMRDLELEPAVPAESIFHYRNKLEYSFTDTPVGAGLGLHRAGRWDEVLDIERCWLTTDLGNAIREAARAWARAEGLAAVRPGGAARLPAPPRRPRGAQHRAGARHARDRAGRARGRGPVRLGAAALPRGAFDPLGGERPARRGDEPADELLWGEPWIEEEILGKRFRVRPNAFLQTNTAMCEQLYGLAARVRRADGHARPSTTSTAESGRSGSRSPSDALTVWGVETSEESVACALENAELNGVTNAAFFAGDTGRFARGAARALRPSPTWSCSTRRAPASRARR